MAQRWRGPGRRFPGFSIAGRRRRPNGGVRRNEAPHTRRLTLEPLEDRTLLSLTNGAEDALSYLVPQHRDFLLGDYLTPPSSAAPLDIARDYLTAHADQIGLNPGEPFQALVTDEYASPDTGMTHIYFRQQLGGLEIVNANVNVDVMADGRILNVGGGFVPGLSAEDDLAASVPLSALSPAEALQSGAAQLNLAASASPLAVAGPGRASDAWQYRFVDPSVSLDVIPAKAHYVATADGVQLAWDLVLRTPDGEHWYDASVDALGGALLRADDWVDHATYDVFARPKQSPDDGPRTLLTDPNDPQASPYGWHDTNGVAGAEYTDTRGNNVFAQEDVDANNTGGFRPDGGSSLNFDFPLDLNQPPSAYQSAAITNLFYWVNVAHDTHYRYGFTEAAGNFQQINYTGQGLGGDPVQADAQDGSGTNNASMSTPPDGQSPRLTMYVYTQTSPYRDGDLDSGVMVHEFGHGVSNRLVGGPSNTSALSATQSGGMGEGWSDWWGLMFTQKATGGKLDPYPHCAYPSGDPPTGPGNRSYPYSFDMAVDPLTYGRYNSSSEVHATGTIWCSALWDMNWLLIDKYGFNPDISGGYTGPTSAGNILALQLVEDSLKLMPVYPTFLDSRDAILLADQALTGGQNQSAIWTAFARRGMGVSAYDGGSANATTVTEAFDVPFVGVAYHSPAGVSTTPVSAIDFHFYVAMDPNSFHVADDVASFTGPGGANLLSQITGSTWTDATTLRVTFNAQTTDGPYAMTIGPQILSALDEQPMDQDGDDISGEPIDDRYSGGFRYDSLLMQVVSTDPLDGAPVTLPATSLAVHFNEPYAPASVGTDDLVLSQGTVTGFTLLDADTVRYTFSGVIQEGTVTINMPAGALTDVFGNPMAAYAGSFIADVGTLALPTLVPATNLSGSLVLGQSVVEWINPAADTDRFTLDLDAGQALTVLVDPAPGLRPTLELRDPAGAVIGSVSAAQAGDDALLQTVALNLPGTYSIAVASAAGTSGQYTLQVLLGAALEDENHNGAGNDSRSTAQNIDGSLLTLATDTQRAAVLGSADSADTDDWYAFTLAAGDRVALAARGQSSPATGLDLWDPAGNLLTAAMAGPTNVDLSTAPCAVPEGGTYYARVSSELSDYTLLVLRNAAFDLEPNNGLAGAQYLGHTGACLGSLGSDGDADDYYQVAVAAGDTLTLWTSTPGDGPHGTNTLDPALELYDPGGNRVAADDNHTPDARNAQLFYSALAGGTYTIHVSAANAGDYLLNVDGATGQPAPLTVVGSTPANGGTVQSAASVTVDCSAGLLMTSVQGADLTVDGIPAMLVEPWVVDSQTVTFALPASLSPGVHHAAMAGGALSSVAGVPLQAWSADFTVDPPALYSLDINTSLASSNPQRFVAIGNTTFFVAGDAAHGDELWKTDGTATGTVMLKDIDPGSTGSSPNYLTNLNGLLYFSATDGTNGLELWRSDGTAAGTVLVKDIYAGSGSSYAEYLTNVSGNLYFTAFVSGNGYELWKSDGTSPGTVMVKDIYAGGSSSNPSGLTNVNGALFFRATDGPDGIELWTSDGTSSGTTMVNDIYPGSSSSSPSSLSNVNGTLFFTATNGTNGVELWHSDGTSSGTFLVNDIYAGSSSSSINYLTNVNGTLFFAANNGTNGTELWQSDGTDTGTMMVSDIYSGVSSSAPLNLANVNGTLFFSASNAANGKELWTSDGTSSGTVMVKDINAGGLSSTPSSLTNVNGMLFFTANNGTSGTELWQSNGTSAGTVMLKDIRPGASGSTFANLTNVNGALLFQADDGAHGAELWQSDGTASGTQMVADIRTGTADALLAAPSAAVCGNTLYFGGSNTTSYVQLWKTDGTSAGTVMVQNPSWPTADPPARLTNVSGTLFFEGYNSSYGYELWRSDGTATGTGMVKDISPGTGSSSPNYLTNVNGTLFFSAGDGTNGSELWRSDGTSSGTVLVNDIYAGSSSSSPANLFNRNGILYFSASNGTNGTELWRSDGTSSGTVLVKDIVAGSNNSSPAYLTDLNGTLFFAAYNANNGTELWRSDGTSSGTILVKDVYAGSSSSSPANLTNVNGTLFFAANSVSNGTELWRSDGTSSGTLLVKDIYAGSNGSSPANLTNVNGTFFFTAGNDVNGTELWISDGTGRGTVMVRDIFAGSGSAAPQSLTNVAGALFFTADDGVHGREVWTSDGTAAGTRLLADVMPGADSSTPASLIALGRRLFFAASDNSLIGREPRLVMAASALSGSVASAPTDLALSADYVVENQPAGTPIGILSSEDATPGHSFAYSLASGPGDADNTRFAIDGATLETAMPLDFEAQASYHIRMRTTGDNGLSFDKAFTITCADVNEPPVAAADSYVLSSGGPLTVAAGGVLGNDADPEGRPLSASLAANPSHGTVTLNADGSFTYTPAAGYQGCDLFTYWASDGLLTPAVPAAVEVRVVPPQVVADINTLGADASPSNFVAVGNTTFFTATDTFFGSELWQTDGTSAGTLMVKDIYPGTLGSAPASLTNVNGVLFFAANTANGGTELWRSDGTAAGTAMVKDIYSGTNSSSPQRLTNVNGVLYFMASSSSGYELWKSDGTSSGTLLVRDIYAGAPNSSPNYLTNVNGVLYFSANNGTNGTELWKSDGTSSGTTLVKDIYSGSSSSSPANLTNVNGTVFFAANDGTNGSELWMTDGTDSGTVLVKDINPGNGSSSPANLTNVNGTLFLAANNGTNGIELWKSDGSDAGTVMVEDIDSGSSNSSPNYLINLAGTLFFAANDGVNYYTELWKSNGTSIGTSMVADIYPSSSSFPAYLTNVNGTLFFSASDGNSGYELWKSDGTSAGTILVDDIWSGSSSSIPLSLANIQGTLYFSANDRWHGKETWTSDGTSRGTQLLRDIATDTADAAPGTLTAVGNTLYFAANDGLLGSELWRTDATAGAVLVKDIDPGSGSSGVAKLINVSGTLYFTATDGSHGTELWRSDGTGAGTVMLKDIYSGGGSSSPAALANVNGVLFFVADNNTNGVELWRSDGTSAGTVLVKDVWPGASDGCPTGNAALTNVNGTLFFVGNDGTDGNELWMSDGTESGTAMVKDIYPGAGNATVANLTNVNGTLCFSAANGSNGVELWKSNGTSLGTVLVKDIYAGSGNSSPGNLAAVGGTLYFSATNGTNGIELWKSDGSSSGTLLVKDIYSGSTNSSPANLTNVNGTLFFAASSSGNGVELWRSDGTSSGTLLVKDIYTGSSSGSPSYLANVGGALYFAANDGSNGVELWRSDGTSAGTVLMDLVPGGGASSPQSIVDVGGTAFFTAGDVAVGVELWAMRPNVAPTDIQLSAATVAEERPPGTFVGTLSSSDRDFANTFTYSLVPGAGDADNVAFFIGSGGQRLTAASFDYETKSAYSIRVRSTDQAGLWVEKPLTIAVTDVNAPPSGLALSSLQVPPHRPLGTTVGTLSTTDAENPAAPFTYALVPGPGSADFAAFSIVGDQLQTAAAFDDHTRSSYSIRVRTTDQGGLWYEETLPLTVTDSNEPPVLAPVGDRSADEGCTLTFTATATDADLGQHLTFSLDPGAPAGAAIDPVTGVFTWAPPNGPATAALTIRVSDDGSPSLDAAETITITVANVAPMVLATNVSVTANEGQTAGNMGTWSDVAADTVTLSASAGTVTENADHTWSWSYTPDNGPTTSTITITAHDGDAGTSTTSFTLSVLNLAPRVLASNTSVTANEGQTVSNVGTWSDVAADTVSLSASVGVVTRNSNGSWSYTPDDGPATQTVTITANDQDGGTSSTTFAMRVLDVLPTAAIGGPATGPEGTPITLIGSVSEPSSADAATLSYAWNVNKNGSFYVHGSGPNFTFTPNDQGTYVATLTASDKDGSGTASRTMTIADVPPGAWIIGPSSGSEGTPITLAGLASDPSTVDAAGGFTYTWNVTRNGNFYVRASGPSLAFTPNDQGNYLATLTAVEINGSSGVGTQTISVADVLPTAAISGPTTGTEGAAITLTGSASDPSSVDAAAGFSYRWNVTKDNSAYSMGSGGSFAFTPNDQGSYVATLVATGRDGSSPAATRTITVGNVAPIASIGKTSNVSEGTPITLTGSATDPSSVDAAAGLSYAWRVNKDGNFYIQGNAASFTFTPSDQGSYLATLTATDKDHGSGTATRTIVVGNVAPTVTLSGPTTGDEGSPLTLGSTVTDPSSDDTTLGFAYAWSVSRNGNFYLRGSGSESFTFTPNDQGTYVATLTATDKDNGSRAGNRTIVVGSVAPTVTLSKPGAVNEGTAITLSGTVVDPSTADSAWGFTYAWTVTKNGSAYASGNDASPAFTPDDNGTYTATLTATDKDGASGTSSKTLTVGNVPPSVTINKPGTAVEGALLTLSAAVNDPSSADTAVGFGYDWSVTKNGSFYRHGTDASLTFTPDDNGTYVATLTASDKDGYSGTATRTFTVVNVAPTASFSNNGPVAAGSTAVVALSAVLDPSSMDTTAGLRYAYDFDDNGTFEVGSGTYAGSVTVSSATVPGGYLATSGTRVVRARIIDKDNDYTDYTTSITVGSPLLAQDMGPGGSASIVDQAAAQSILAAAVARWSAAGADVSLLRNTQLRIADLPGATLGLASEGSIWLDINAAGHGWFIDATPQWDEEFVAQAAGDWLARDARAAQGMDLLTVISHELGHLLGRPDLYGEAHNLMAAALAEGIRRVPAALPGAAAFGSDRAALASRLSAEQTAARDDLFALWHDGRRFFTRDNMAPAGAWTGPGGMAPIRLDADTGNRLH